MLICSKDDNLFSSFSYDEAERNWKKNFSDFEKY